jgi:hypothetical protein
VQNLPTSSDAPQHGNYRPPSVESLHRQVCPQRRRRRDGRSRVCQVTSTPSASCTGVAGGVGRVVAIGGAHEAGSSGMTRDADSEE